MWIWDAAPTSCGKSLSRQRDGSWEEFRQGCREKEKSSEWTLEKIRETYEKVAKEEIGRLGIVQEILKKILTSVESVRGVRAWRITSRSASLNRLQMLHVDPNKRRRASEHHLAPLPSLSLMDGMHCARILLTFEHGFARHGVVRTDAVNGRDGALWIYSVSACNACNCCAIVLAVSFRITSPTTSLELHLLLCAAPSSCPTSESAPPFGASTPAGPPPFWAPTSSGPILLGPHPSGPPLDSGFGPPTLLAPFEIELGTLTSNFNVRSRNVSWKSTVGPRSLEASSLHTSTKLCSCAAAKAEHSRAPTTHDSHMWQCHWSLGNLQ